MPTPTPADDEDSPAGLVSRDPDVALGQGAEPGLDEDPGRGAAAGGSGRLLAYTVGWCVAGSGLALFAATRVWSVQVTARPGLPDLRTTRTGAAELPWLPALALVGLAGVGALLATRGWPRRAVGVLLAAVGAGLVIVVLAGQGGRDAGAAGVGGVLWPWIAALGGVAVAVGGWWTVRHGARWPAMGARYERRPAAGSPPQESNGSAASAAAGRIQSRRPVETRAAWEALDRGDDPTVD